MNSKLDICETMSYSFLTSEAHPPILTAEWSALSFKIYIWSEPSSSKIDINFGMRYSSSTWIQKNQKHEMHGWRIEL